MIDILRQFIRGSLTRLHRQLIEAQRKFLTVFIGKSDSIFSICLSSKDNFRFSSINNGISMNFEMKCPKTKNP